MCETIADTDILSEEECWRAFEDRDAGYDGRFVVAVRSTGIYCRPSCPARRPMRRNVVFYPVGEAAEREGFRPCRRCKPEEVLPQARAVEQASRYIEEHLDRNVTLHELGEAVGLSPHHLQRVFKRTTGISPRAYADSLRLGAVKAGLRERDDVTTAMYDAGYGSSSRLYERADAQLGMTPGVYRRGGAGMEIGYTIVDSPLGRLLVGATERGVSAVCLGEDDATLEEALVREYPAATIHRGDRELDDWVGDIVAHLSGRLPHLDLPIDVQTTAFKRRVWEALREIPYGETRGYAEIARQIGSPKAVRAVASACATNPVAIVVPCHRVIRTDGTTGGYRWGEERKQALLAREHVANVEEPA